MARIVPEVPLSKVSPAYLHSNSTSHTWVFSAIAELIDNAYDPDVSATELWIDRVYIRGKPCLTVEDNGRGMDHNYLLLMLSFGYCEKAKFDTRKHKPIGIYGNGFKSGSMRLAKDALVFTVSNSSASVGFLSQTYLLETKADSVRVPMIEYSLPELKIVSDTADTRALLDTILEFSPYSEEGDIKKELEQLRKHHKRHTGTKIVLFNLKRHKNGLMELDFDSDPEDIRNPEVHEVDASMKVSQAIQNETEEYVSSLRRYCSILYLRPRVKINIRGVKVKSMLISESLSNTEKDKYRPSWLEKPLGITLGFVPRKTSKKTDEFGVMFYHCNRLIKAFEKVGYQKQPNALGVGVVGVVHDADFLTPTHNKQDFIRDEKYNSLLAALGRKLNEYWDTKTGQSGSGDRLSREVADWNWAQCEKCSKWRRLHECMRGKELPDKWYCHMNFDSVHNRCEVPEEPHLAGEEITKCTYTKVSKPPPAQKRKRKTKKELEVKKAEVDAKIAELAVNVFDLANTKRKRKKSSPRVPRAASATQGKKPRNSPGRKARKGKLTKPFPNKKKARTVPAMTSASDVCSAGIGSDPLDLSMLMHPSNMRAGTSTANYPTMVTTTHTGGVTTTLPMVTDSTIPNPPATSRQYSEQLKTNAKLISHVVSLLQTPAGIGALSSVSPPQPSVPASNSSSPSLQASSAVSTPLGACTSELRSSSNIQNVLKMSGSPTTAAVHNCEGKDTDRQGTPQAMADRGDLDLNSVLDQIDGALGRGSQVGSLEWETKYALLYQQHKKLAKEKEKLFQEKRIAEEKEQLLQTIRKFAEEANKKIAEEKEQLFQANKKMAEEKQKVEQEKQVIEEQKKKAEQELSAMMLRFKSVTRDIRRLLVHTIDGFSCEEEEVEESLKAVIRENIP